VDIDGSQPQALRRPGSVTAAGYLLVIPAAFGWVMPLVALRVLPSLAIACLIACSLTTYGMFAVSLNWRGARWTAALGAVLLTLLAVGLILESKAWAAVFWVFCMPAAVLLLGPQASRDWFAAQAGTDSSR
jgi:hypothetical protein